MKKIQFELKQQRKKRFTALTGFIIGVTMLLALVQLILSNQLASFGKEIFQLGSEEKALSAENERLKKEIAKESSIATISQKAQTASMSASTSFLVVGEADSVALGLR